MFSEYVLNIRTEYKTRIINTVQSTTLKIIILTTEKLFETVLYRISI